MAAAACPDEDCDPELDDLLASALQDFDQPAQTSTNKSGSSKGNESLESSVDPLTSTDTQAHNPDPLEDILSDEMARKATEELDQAMRMLVGDNPEMMQQLEQFAQNMEETMSRLQCDEDAEYSDTESGSRRDSARQMTGADEDAKAEGLSIEEKLAQTVRELGKNAQDMKVYQSQLCVVVQPLLCCPRMQRFLLVELMIYSVQCLVYFLVMVIRSCRVMQLLKGCCQ
jgi:hypothetical protein